MIPVADFEKNDFFDHLEMTDKIKNFFFFLILKKIIYGPLSIRFSKTK